MVVICIPHWNRLLNNVKSIWRTILIPGTKYKWGLLQREHSRTIWQIQFSELPRKGGVSVLTGILTDASSGWPEAFPCRANKAREVTRVLLNDVIPQSGAPVMMSSGRTPVFCEQVVQEVGKMLGMDWQLHTQASRLVEKMNHLIKHQVIKTLVRQLIYIGIKHS